MGQILLVRHGQASWGAADYDVLSDLGEEQGTAVGRALADLRPDVVVHGTMLRHCLSEELDVDDACWTASRFIV